MSHRRAFLKQVGGMAGAATLGRLVGADRAFASGLQRLSSSHGGHARWSRLADEYLLDPSVRYLNHASIGTVPRLVHEAHREYLAACETNPWLYMWGGAWEEPREAVRAGAARMLGCDPSDVALTHNTTEGFNLLAQGLPLGRGDDVVFSSLNHPGASVCWRHHGGRRGYSVREFDFPVERVPELDADDIVDIHAAAITDRTRVLVFPHVDNVVGLRHPMRRLARAARERGVEFVAVDGAQTVGMLQLDLGGSDVDFYAASPHKWLQSPKGLGLLYARPEARPAVRPMWVTWGQERWADSVRVLEDYGTRNLPELLAMGDAIEFQSAIPFPEREMRYRSLWKLLRETTSATSGAVWRSPAEWSLSASLVAVEFEGIDVRELLTRTNREGGYVFRAFGGDRLNTARLSPNLATEEETIRTFFAAASS